MCCGSCGSHSPKHVARMLLRWSFSLSLIFVGLTHYMQIGSFSVMVSDGLGPLGSLGLAWSYILPGLLIIGGVLLLIGRYMDIGVWATGIALGSIPAGMLLKPLMTGMSLDDTMPPAIQAFIWLIVFMYAVKGGGHSSKGDCCSDHTMCPGCGHDPCMCGKKNGMKK